MASKKLNSNEKFLGIHQLIDYIKSTSRDFSFMNDRLDKIQVKVEKLPNEISSTDDAANSDKLHKMELKIAEMSEEINNINETLIEIFLLFRSQIQTEKRLRSYLDPVSLKYSLNRSLDKPPSETLKQQQPIRSVNDSDTSEAVDKTSKTRIEEDRSVNDSDTSEAVDKTKKNKEIERYY